MESLNPRIQKIDGVLKQVKKDENLDMYAKDYIEFRAKTIKKSEYLNQLIEL
jgi:hypothetical protein